MQIFAVTKIPLIRVLLILKIYSYRKLVNNCIFEHKRHLSRT